MGARAVAGELRDTWRCGHPNGRYPGGYAAGFLDRAKALFSVEPVLHVCSGGVDEDERVDLFHDVVRPRPDGVRGVRPTVLADGRALPFKSGSFGLVLIDSPWSAKWTETMYALRRADYPSPDALLAEAVRVCAPGGFVGMMHLIIPPTPAGTRRVARIDVVAGNDKNARLRRFTAFQKFLEAEPSTVSVLACRQTGQPDVRRTRSRGSRKAAKVAPRWTLENFGVV